MVKKNYRISWEIHWVCCVNSVAWLRCLRLRHVQVEWVESVCRFCIQSPDQQSCLESWDRGKFSLPDATRQMIPSTGSSCRWCWGRKCVVPVGSKLESVGDENESERWQAVKFQVISWLLSLHPWPPGHVEVDIRWDSVNISKTRPCCLVLDSEP